MSRKMLRKGLVIGAVLLYAGAATAGVVSSEAVTIFTDSWSGLQGAKGTLRVARFSADPNQYIGCNSYSYDTGGGPSVICYARTATGGYLSCRSTLPDIVRIVETINPASYITFQVNADGTCDRMITTLASANL